MPKILEVDRRACPRCRTAMRVVAVIAESAEIDRIPRHVQGNGGNDVSTSSAVRRGMGMRFSTE